MATKTISAEDIVRKQNEIHPDPELSEMLAVYRRITEDEHRTMKFDVSLGIRTHSNTGVFLSEPRREIHLRLLPSNELDEEWFRWVDAGKYPTILEWAEHQEPFKDKAQRTVQGLEEQIEGINRMIRLIKDQWITHHGKK